jgi:hypothetical protein
VRRTRSTTNQGVEVEATRSNRQKERKLEKSRAN